MPVVKHLTKRQKKRKKSRKSAGANENKSDKSQKKGSVGKNPSVKQNPTANGVFPKAAAGRAVENSQPRSQTPSSADRPMTALPPPPEMPTYGNQRNSYSNYRYNVIQQNSEIREEEPERDKYYGRQPSNRVLGHLISVENYKKIQGAYEKSTLWKLKRLQANKKKREKLAALAAAAAAAAASKLPKPEVSASPEMAAEAPEPNRSEEPAGEAAPLDLVAAIAEAGLMLDLGPLSFQRYVDGCLDWMIPTINKTLYKGTPPRKVTPKLPSIPTVNPVVNTTVNPIGYEMLAKKRRLAQSTGGLTCQQQDAEDSVLRIAMQMDAMQLKAMTPEDLELAVIASGIDISNYAYRPLERNNWMCTAILNIVDEPEQPKPLWEASSVLGPNNYLPEPSIDCYSPFSGSEIRAQMDRAIAQVPERAQSPIAAGPFVQYQVQKPTYEAVQMPPTYTTIPMPPTYTTIQTPPTYNAVQMPPLYETFQVTPTYEAYQMPSTCEFAQTCEPQHEQEPQEAQIQLESNPPPASAGNRRASNNHVRGRTYYRGGKGRVGQNQRNQNLQQNRQYENNNNYNHGDRYNPYNHQSQFVQDINSILTPPNQMAPVEAHQDMMPMGNPPAQNYGQYQNMPYAPMGYQPYPGPQTVPQPVADQAANFEAPPSINQFNNNNNSNSFGPMMPQPMNPIFQSNANNVQQMQPQQQKFKRSGNKFSTWEAAESPGFVQFSGEARGAPYMARGRPTQYAPTYGVETPLQVPCVPAKECDFTLSDTNFPPLPVPFKNRKEKGKSSNNYM